MNNQRAGSEMFLDFEKFKSLYQKHEVVEFSNAVPEDPVVSICVQTYQHKKYLESCLNSILAQQTNFNYEILLGEDGSTDGTRELCIEYAEKYPEKIKLFLHHRENQIKVLGEPTSNFNAFYNFFSAKGRYIAFCEGDDYWDDPNKLQTQVNFLQNNPSYIFCYHKYEEVDQHQNSIAYSLRLSQPTSDISSAELKKEVVHPLLLTICFRNVIKKIPLGITQVINVDSFLLSLFGNYGQAKFINEINPSKYRRHQGGMWSDRFKRKKFLSKILTFKKIHQFYQLKEENELTEFYKIRLQKNYKMLIINCLKNGNFVAAFNAAGEFIKLK